MASSEEEGDGEESEVNGPLDVDENVEAQPKTFLERVKRIFANKIDLIAAASTRIKRSKPVKLYEADHAFITATYRANRVAFYQLSLSKNDLRVLYKSFKSTDFASAGAITPSDFFSSLGVRSTTFHKLLFNFLDRNLSGLLEFGEFAAGIWELCLLEPSKLPGLAFDLFAKDSDHHMAQANVVQLRRHLIPTAAHPLFDAFLAGEQRLHAGEQRLRQESGKKARQFKLKRRRLEQWLRDAPDNLARVQQVQEQVRGRFGGAHYWAQLAADHAAVATLKHSAAERRRVLALAQEQQVLETQAGSAQARAAYLADKAARVADAVAAGKRDRWGRRVVLPRSAQLSASLSVAQAHKQAADAAEEAAALRLQARARRRSVEAEVGAQEAAEAAVEAAAAARGGGGVRAALDGSATAMTWGDVLASTHGAWVWTEMTVPRARGEAPSQLRKTITAATASNLPRHKPPPQQQSLHTRLRSHGHHALRARALPPVVSRRRRAVWDKPPLDVAAFRANPAFYAAPTVPQPRSALQLSAQQQQQHAGGSVATGGDAVVRIVGSPGGAAAAAAASAEAEAALMMRVTAVQTGRQQLEGAGGSHQLQLPGSSGSGSGRRPAADGSGGSGGSGRATEAAAAVAAAVETDWDAVPVGRVTPFLPVAADCASANGSGGGGDSRSVHGRGVGGGGGDSVHSLGMSTSTTLRTALTAITAGAAGRRGRRRAAGNTAAATADDGVAPLGGVTTEGGGSALPLQPQQQQQSQPSARRRSRFVSTAVGAFPESLSPLAPLPSRFPLRKNVHHH